MVDTPSYIKINWSIILGENYHIPPEELQTFVLQHYHRSMAAKKRRTCTHKFGPWGTYDGNTSMRHCPLCGHKEYK